jgi:uncharacterized protein YndB with AHSA1/START domain
MTDAQAVESLSLELTRVFQATRENVFRAWVDKDELKHRWGPKGFNTEIDTFDATPGGAYRLCMRAPDDSQHWLHGEFKEISPHDFLSMTWIWEGGDMAGHEMLVSITFTAVGDATEIKLTHSNLPSEGAVTAHNEGWTSALECFQETITGSA